MKLPPNILLLYHVRMEWKTMKRPTPQLSSRLGYDIFGASLLTIFSSDVESLRQGIIKTSKNKVQADYTILLFGETGIGKSAFLEFLANVLIANNIDRYNFEILDHSNEQGGSIGQSQTNLARIYELKSKNGILVSVS